MKKNEHLEKIRKEITPETRERVKQCTNDQISKAKALEYWTTADGKKLHVDEMDDEHVRNAFKMLLRQINYLKLKENVVNKSNRAFEVHGEMAREHADAYEIYEETGVEISEYNEYADPYDQQTYDI